MGGKDEEETAEGGAVEAEGEGERLSRVEAKGPNVMITGDASTHWPSFTRQTSSNALGGG